MNELLSNKEILDILKEDFIVKKDLFSNKLVMKSLSNDRIYRYSKTLDDYDISDFDNLLDTIGMCITEYEHDVEEFYIHNIVSDESKAKNKVLLDYYIQVSICSDLKLFMFYLKLYEREKIELNEDGKNEIVDSFLTIKKYVLGQSKKDKKYIFTISDDDFKMQDLSKHTTIIFMNEFIDDDSHNAIYLSMEINLRTYVIIIEKERYSDSISFEINLIEK